LTQTEKVAATTRKHRTLRIEFRVSDERPESGASDYAGERQLLAPRAGSRPSKISAVKRTFEIEERC
jgi:hypothetical protein